MSGKLIDQLVQCERQSPVSLCRPLGCGVLAPQLAQEYVYVRCLGHREGLSDEQPRVIVGAAGEPLDPGCFAERLDSMPGVEQLNIRRLKGSAAPEPTDSLFRAIPAAVDPLEVVEQ